MFLRGADLFSKVQFLKKSLGIFGLEATLMRDLFLSRDWLLLLRCMHRLSFPRSIEQLIQQNSQSQNYRDQITVIRLAMKQKEKSKDKKKEKEVEKEKETQEVDEDIEHVNFIEIEKLQEFGINAADIAKLKTSGFCTITSIVMATKKELVNIKGINEAKIDKILEAARKIENHGFMSGNQIAQKRKNVVRITTGSPILDELLGGGIQTMAITEAFGEFRTGKTQLAHTLCVTTQLPKEKGGGNGKVIYIDTEGTFRPQRILKIAERYGLDGQEALENIRYARGYTVEHLITLLNFAAAMMMESPHSLMIIDSIMAVFRNDYTGRGQLSERQQVLGKVLSKLIKLAEQFNVAIYMTNQVMADPGNTMAHVDPKKPIGGHVLAHASTTRLYFRKGKGEQRICKIFDSPCLAENQATFQISEGGIIDAKE